MTLNIEPNPNDIQLGDFDLLEMDSADDKILSEILTQTENFLKSKTDSVTSPPVSTVMATKTVQQNMVNCPIPIIYVFPPLLMSPIIIILANKCPQKVPNIST